MRIFLSYRRADVGGYAGRLSDSLVQRLGAQNVFQDVTDITAGRDFVTAIREALDGCDAAIAVIGPGWLSASTPEGAPRLFQPDDYVRLELATVLSRNLPVAPVLVGGAALPAAADLPEDLRPLVRRQALALRDETWRQDVENLLRSLRGETADAPGLLRRRSGVVVGATAVVVAAVVAALTWWRPWVGGPSGTGRATPPTSSSSTSSSASASLAKPPPCPDPTGSGWTRLSTPQDSTAQEQSGKGSEIFSVRAARWRPLPPGKWQVVVDTTLENRIPDDFSYHDDYRYNSIVVAGRLFRQTCFQGSPVLVRSGTVSDGRTGYVVSCKPEGRVELLLADPSAPRLPLTDAPQPSQC